MKRLKALKLEITSADTDFEATGGQIREYCKKAMMNPYLSRNMMLVYDEIIMQNLVSRASPDPEIYPIHLAAEYAEADGSLTVVCKWGGKAYNPIEEGDELSARIVTKLAKDVSYRYDEGNELEISF